jgi:hypothetical protein
MSTGLNRRDLFISPYLDSSCDPVDQCIGIIDATESEEYAIAFYKRKNIYSKLVASGKLDILSSKHHGKFASNGFDEWVNNERLFSDAKAKIHEDANKLSGDPFEFNDTMLALINQINAFHGSLDISNSAKAEVLKKLLGVFFKHHTNGSCEIHSPKLRSSINPIFEDHIRLLVEHDNISELEDFWRYFDYTIAKNSADEYTVLPKYDDDYLVKILRRVSNIAINDWTSRVELDNIDYSFTITNKLPPYSYVNTFEKISYSALKNYVFDVTKDVSGYKIAECIRAYAVIQFIASTSTDEIIVISKSKFRSELSRFGIPYNSITRLTHFLQFTSKTSDMCHSPLLDSDDNFLIIKNIGSEINPAQSFLGALKDKEVDVSARGKLFEKKIASRFKPLKTKSNLKDKIGKEQYECDICIQFDSAVFIECKTHHFPWTTRELYKHCFKIFADHKKSTRTFSYYMNNSEKVETKYKLKIGSNPLYILVTNTPFGGIHKFDDIYLTDSSSLERFLCRIPPAIVDLGNQTKTEIGKYSDLYSGELTLQKLRTFLETNPTITEVTCSLNNVSFIAAEKTWNTSRHIFNENMIFIPKS